MALPSYSTGTATVDAGGTNVALTDGTTAFNNVFAGDTFCIGTASAKVVDVVDDGNFTITPWPGSAESGAAYTVLQDSALRFTDVEIAIDLKKQVQALNTEGFYVFVPSSVSEPDPSLGDDGQYAFQAPTGKLWIRESGAWSFLGVYKGFGLPAAYDSGNTYSLFDTATSDGSTYVWINATAGSSHAPPNATYWSVLAGKGDAGAPGATILTQDAEPDTDHPDNSLWIDSDSADLDVYVLTGSPPAWSDTGMNLKGTTGPVAWLPPVAWTTGTDFVEGPPASVVTQGGETYVCLEPHTSGTFATDLAAGKWIKVAAKGADGTGTGDLVAANNLSDLADAATARTNLGLGTAATTAASAYATAAQGATADSAVQPAAIREKLTANRTYYVDATNGSDSNNGLASGSGHAFATIQKAIDVACGLDLSICNVTIQLAAGTYTGANTLKTYLGVGPITVLGDASTPSNVTVSTGSSHAFRAAGVLGSWTLNGLKIQTTNGHGIYASDGSRVNFQSIEFGSVSAGSHILSIGTGTTVTASGGYKISGGASRHWWAENGALITAAAKTITLSGTPAFTGAFAFTQTAAILQVNGNTYSGTGATGKIYDASLNAVVYAGGTTLPGNTTGTTTTGAQFL